MFNKILVAVDPSPICDQVFDEALSLAKSIESDLTILHVLDVFDPNSPGRSLLPMDGFSSRIDTQM